MSLPFTLDRTDPTVLTVRMEDISKGWESWVLLRSDAHHDSADCDVAMEKRHLDQALERDAAILDFGDLFDAMDSREDKRRDKAHLPVEIRTSDLPYMNAILDYNGRFYEPYAANWVMLIPGNHETKHKDFDLTTLLADRLRVAGGQVESMPYQGWVRFMFRWNQTKQKSYRLWYTHGHGGASGVTKGVPQNARQMAFLGNADFIVNGHTHTGYWVTDVKHSLDVNGKPQSQNVELIRIPGYKQEWEKGSGFSVERGHGPKPRFAWWMRFFCEEDQIQYEIRQAK